MFSLESLLNFHGTKINCQGSLQTTQQRCVCQTVAGDLEKNAQCLSGGVPATRKPKDNREDICASHQNLIIYGSLIVLLLNLIPFRLHLQFSVSLNEAAYPGINLRGDMLDLLLLFRTNVYVLLPTLKKTSFFFFFLIILLFSEAGKSCFF